jgi:hypothetical protein
MAFSVILVCTAPGLSPNTNTTKHSFQPSHLRSRTSQLDRVKAKPSLSDSRDPVDPDCHPASLELRTGALQDPHRGVLGGCISWRTHPSEGRGEGGLSGRARSVCVETFMSIWGVGNVVVRRVRCNEVGVTHGDHDRPARIGLEQGSVHHPSRSPLDRVEHPDGVDVERSLL